MEDNKEQSVEVISEPKLETRFGFAIEEKPLPREIAKYCAIASGLSLLLIISMKSPEKEIEVSPQLTTPEASQINSNSDRQQFESYSVSQENERLKQNNKKPRNKIIVRLPGLQKIDRRKSSQVPPGSMIKAILVTGASNGPVRTEITEPLRIQGEILLPVGATLLGTGQSTEDRLMIRFTQVIFKDGSFDTIQAQAVDIEDKMVGLKGSRLGKYAFKYATAIGLNFVGGLTEGLQEREVLGQQVVTKTNAKNALLNGANKATIELANETMTGIKNSASEIQIPAGQNILIIF